LFSMKYYHKDRLLFKTRAPNAGIAWWRFEKFLEKNPVVLERLQEAGRKSLERARSSAQEKKVEVAAV